ncbi:MAG: TonB family protein [Prevotella sp.]|nr:TonB family protein [Prevotella sp.]
MKTKKTLVANLEEKRKTHFLLGLILALTILFVGLEYTTRSEPAVAGEKLLDDMAQDLELLPVTDQRDMVAMLQRKSMPAVAEKINEVKEVVTHEGAELPQPTVEIVQNGEADAQTAVEKTDKPETNAADLSNQPLSFRVVEELPEFPGGLSAFVGWLTKRLNYPPMARQQRIQGKVVVGFIVNKDGSVADLKIVKSLHTDLDREAMRVMQMMPKWKPGKQKGVPCRTVVSVPIVFKL